MNAQEQCWVAGKGYIPCYDAFGFDTAAVAPTNQAGKGASLGKFPYRIAQLRDVKDAIKWVNENYPRASDWRTNAIADLWNRTPDLLKYYKPLRALAKKQGLLAGLGCGCSSPVTAQMFGMGALGDGTAPQLDSADQITKTANAVFGLVNSAAKNYFMIKAMNNMKAGTPMTMDQAVNQESFMDKHKTMLISGIVVAGIAAFFFFRKRR